MFDWYRGLCLWCNIQTTGFWKTLKDRLCRQQEREMAGDKVVRTDSKWVSLDVDLSLSDDMSWDTVSIFVFVLRVMVYGFCLHLGFDDNCLGLGLGLALTVLILCLETKTVQDTWRLTSCITQDSLSLPVGWCAAILSVNSLSFMFVTSVI